MKIDGIAASAASVIAMAGNTVLMSPVSMMMIHNPATVAFGDISFVLCEHIVNLSRSHTVTARRINPYGNISTSGI